LSSGEEIIKKIGRCLIEPKYDGFRLQIHYQDKKVRLYSRSLEDVTYMYPDIVFSVEKEIKAKEIIFEGEAIGYNQKTSKFLPFQETVQRKRKFNIEEKVKEVPLKLFVFELLYLNGENYLNQHYLARRKKLEIIIKSDKNIKDNNILLAPTELISDAQKINTLFSKAVDQGLEGIIAKKINGIYQPGARGWNWIKFKKSYASKINDTVDCLIIGYDLGKGKRTGFGIGAFLVGVYDEKNDRFVTVAKIGTGLTDEEWKKLRLQSAKFKIKNKPKNYFVDKMMECDVWLAPAIVVEIRADEISKSPVHTAGLALRFPRLERFREDKKPEETTTLKEIKEIFNHQKVMDSV
jgi:DNA ligase-1